MRLKYEPASEPLHISVHPKPPVFMVQVLGFIFAGFGLGGVSRVCWLRGEGLRGVGCRVCRLRGKGCRVCRLRVERCRVCRLRV